MQHQCKSIAATKNSFCHEEIEKIESKEAHTFSSEIDVIIFSSAS